LASAKAGETTRPGYRPIVVPLGMSVLANNPRPAMGDSRTSTSSVRAQPTGRCFTVSARATTVEKIAACAPRFDHSECSRSHAACGTGVERARWRFRNCGRALRMVHIPCNSRGASARIALAIRAFRGASNGARERDDEDKGCGNLDDAVTSATHANERPLFQPIDACTHVHTDTAEQSNGHNEEHQHTYEFLLRAAHDRRALSSH
jgi:hypothetical protein